MDTIRFGLLVALALLLPALQARGQSDEDKRTIIMAPEPGTKPAAPQPWLAPKYRSPQGTRQHVRIPQTVPAPQHPAQLPPPLYVPETGRLLPNLPSGPGSGPHGSETYQDRAARCANQASVYGQAAGNPSAYINSCINQ
jgi:hypothetical protein